MNTHFTLNLVWTGLAQPNGWCGLLAYLDPGVGSYVFQLLIAGFTALVFFLVGIRRKLSQWFASLSRNGKPPGELQGGPQGTPVAKSKPTSGNSGTAPLR